MGFPHGSYGKESTHNAGDTGLIHGWGRSPGGENGNSFQYSSLGNPVDREAWWVIVHGVTKELDPTEHVCIHAYLKISKRVNLESSHHTHKTVTM